MCCPPNQSWSFSYRLFLLIRHQNVKQIKLSLDLWLAFMFASDCLYGAVRVQRAVFQSASLNLFPLVAAAIHALCPDRNQQGLGGRKVFIHTPSLSGARLSEYPPALPVAYLNPRHQVVARKINHDFQRLYQPRGAGLKLCIGLRNRQQCIMRRRIRTSACVSPWEFSHSSPPRPDGPAWGKSGQWQPSE